MARGRQGGKIKLVLMVREETKIIRDAQRSTKKCW